MKEKLFKDKEEYLKMRKQWATYFNTKARKLERGMYGNKERKLRPEHFMIYALIRGKDPMVPIQGCSKETHQSCKWSLNHDWLYTNSIFGELFGLTSEQIELIKKEAAKLPFKEQPENQKKERVPMTEDVLMNCLA